MSYFASEKRYDGMKYNRCGKSGLMLPAVSLGLWHNFGTNDDFETMRQMCFTAFNAGITHFDLANNYGPLPGSAEENFGKILKEDLDIYRDELIISTKTVEKMLIAIHYFRFVSKSVEDFSGDLWYNKCIIISRR